jgi:hypothetical protein
MVRPQGRISNQENRRVGRQTKHGIFLLHHHYAHCSDACQRIFEQIKNNFILLNYYVP